MSTRLYEDLLVLFFSICKMALAYVLAVFLKALISFLEYQQPHSLSSSKHMLCVSPIGMYVACESANQTLFFSTRLVLGGSRRTVELSVVELFDTVEKLSVGMEDAL